LPPVLVCRVARDARVQRRVDRHSFRSPQGGAIPRVFIAVLRYVAPCPGLPCRARRPRPAEGRPKFISVAAGGRFRECLSRFSDALPPVQVCRVARDACRWRSVDRNLFRSPQGGTIPRVFIAVLRYVAPCPGLPCRARRLRPAEGRPKFISVTAGRDDSTRVYRSSQMRCPLSWSAVSRETPAAGGA